MKHNRLHDVTILMYIKTNLIGNPFREIGTVNKLNSGCVCAKVVRGDISGKKICRLLCLKTCTVYAGAIWIGEVHCRPKLKILELTSIFTLPITPYNVLFWVKQMFHCNNFLLFYPTSPHCHHVTVKTVTQDRDDRFIALK